MKKLLAIMLALIMVLAMVPAMADNPPTSGNCGAEGDNVTWKLEPNNTDTANPTYTLTISGSGAMADYDGWNKQPWCNSLGKATKFVVEDGVTNIGAYTTNCINRIEEYVIGRGVKTIGGFGISTDYAKKFTLSNNTEFKVVDGVLFSADGKTLYAYPGGREKIEVYEVPQDVTTVVDGAFVGAKMKKLIIHNQINGLPSWTFQRCTVEYLELNETDTVGTPDTNIHEAFRGLNIKDLKIAGGTIGRMELGAYEYSGAPANPKLEKVTITELPTVPQGSVIDDHTCFGVFWGQSHLTTVDLSRCGNVGSASKGTFKDTKASMIAFYFDKKESADNFKSTDAYERNNAVFAVLNGGSIPSTEGWYKEQFALATPVKEGYRFEGWYKNADFSGDPITTVEEAGSTYYAKWTAKPQEQQPSGGGNGGGYYNPTTTPVPVIVIPPKTGDMTIWQSILHFLGIR